jgi:2-oxoisovalerate dehydrogenase E2 component (dihydrolipoyl transacylase)
MLGYTPRASTIGRLLAANEPGARMSAEIFMPQLGESIVEGTVSRWLMAEGQPVQQDQPLLQITTDKVDTELPAPASGILLKILVPEGQTVAKGTVLGVIGDEGSGVREQESEGVDTRTLGFISPVVARLADELHVDLARVSGTGAGGRITKNDVMAYAAATRLTPGAVEKGSPEMAASVSGDQSSVPAPDIEAMPLSAIRRSIARHMVFSKQTAPHATTVMEADMTPIARARERLRDEFERQGVRLTFTPFFLQAIAAGIRAVPEANSSFSDDALLIHRRLHIGMAVAIPDGLIVPVIRDAGEKSLLELARAVNDLAERARANRLTPEEVQGGTFTLTNYGTSGSMFAIPIINQPQAGILGIGAVQKRAVVVSRGHPLLPDPEDAIAIRPMAYLSFTFDHRILDGRDADRFLAAAKRFLEDYQG